MNESLAEIVARARCTCVGWEGIREAGHRQVVAVLVEGFAGRPEVTVLVEPSLVRSAERPPDVVVVDPASGVHVIEVKGITLEQIERVVAGEIHVRYAGRVRPQNPIKQVRDAMFDIKNGVERAREGEAVIPFLWWVAFPALEREAFTARFALDLPELLFRHDLDATRLAGRLVGRGRAWLERHARDQLSPEDLVAIRRAFGDSAVLEDPRRAHSSGGREGTLGEFFHELARAEKRLSEEQQTLAAGDWRGGPRLIRGVAGSGKTVVLAAHLARRMERTQPGQGRLFADQGDRPPRFLVVCFNRTLVPFIRQKLEAAWHQRTGQALPEARVQITHFNQLMHELGTRGLVHYQPIQSGGTDRVAERASQYLADLDYTLQSSPAFVETFRYEAVYVDEAQDLHPDEIRFLTRLARVATEGGEPEVYLFYDDAQNLYGRPRPVWEQLGVRMKGRSHVMVTCHRNTRSIVEPAFNVLLGATAPEGVRVQTRQFADTNYLEKEREVLSQEQGLWRVHFAGRDGAWPVIHQAADPEDEDLKVLARLRWLLEDEDVRPEDVLVLGLSRERLRRLARALQDRLPVQGVVLPFEPGQKDDALARPGCLTVSTIHTAKGYDAFAVLLVSANQFPTTREGRAAFYVGCTRAREHLDIFCHGDEGLAIEFRAALSALKERVEG